MESAYLTKLCARRDYLTKLQQLNLVTPSIYIPFPKHPVTAEKMIVHNAMMQIQVIRTKKLSKEIQRLRFQKNYQCKKTLYEQYKNKLFIKINHLKNKFKPYFMDTQAKKDKKEKNKKSRERYNTRKMNKQIQQFNLENNSNVINLSNHRLTKVQKFVLEHGHGYVPTPQYNEKEEEILILEGFRVNDRIHQLDRELTQEDEKQDRSPKNELEEIQNIFNESNNDSFYGFSDKDITFTRPKDVPQFLKYHQPTEGHLTHPITKKIQKEFDEFNNQLINQATKKKRKVFNLPKKARQALSELKALVRNKKIDIRKVDKGQLIVLMDYSERKKIEEQNIMKIAEICVDQESNWKENRQFVETQMKKLYHLKFISRQELSAVTGLLAGGANGMLKTNSGGKKFTHATDSNELFTQQRTPYVYPLLKAHKLSLSELKEVQPHEVHQKVPSRLVVGMASCQLTRVQSWLEHFLSPLSKTFGLFEYTKDTTSILRCVDNVNKQIHEEHWNLKKATLFSIDVKALYPSVKLVHLEKALKVSFTKWTDWSQTIVTILTRIIMYTLETQQIFWNDNYYMLNQGIPTGGKHCVPLANILLTFIITELIETDNVFKSIFSKNLKIWKRFIDDCFGMFMGKERLFKKFYKKLVTQFQKYDLEITEERSKSSVQILDLVIYIKGNQLHTRENRKETASNNYLRFGSAHPLYTFKGIVKSQMYRLRRLCSNNDDFKHAIGELKKRCLNSGYDENMVKEILEPAKELKRDLKIRRDINENKSKRIRWITMSNSHFEKDISNFVKKMNTVLKDDDINFEIIKTTAPNIGSLLFNNFSKPKCDVKCSIPCEICDNDARGDIKTIVSSISNITYHINNNIKCDNSGIYGITCECLDQYGGKTTVGYNKRYFQHGTLKSSAVKEHLHKCKNAHSIKDMKIQFLENVWDRGKYSLSEREYLWNKRLRGTINIQKTLKAS